MWSAAVQLLMCVWKSNIGFMDKAVALFVTLSGGSGAPDPARPARVLVRSRARRRRIPGQWPLLHAVLRALPRGYNLTGITGFDRHSGQREASLTGHNLRRHLSRFRPQLHPARHFPPATQLFRAHGPVGEGG